MYKSQHKVTKLVASCIKFNVCRYLNTNLIPIFTYTTCIGEGN